MVTPSNNPRPVWPAIWRGIKCRCPRCGKGRLLHRYLEQVDTCPVCHEPLGGYNVGLFLPFIVITVVINVIAFVMLDMELNGRGNPQTYLFVLVPLAAIVPLVILPSCKGGIIGLLWAKGWSDELSR